MVAKTHICPLVYVGFGGHVVRILPNSEDDRDTLSSCLSDSVSITCATEVRDQLEPFNTVTDWPVTGNQQFFAILSNYDMLHQDTGSKFPRRCTYVFNNLWPYSEFQTECLVNSPGTLTIHRNKMRVSECMAQWLIWHSETPIGMRG